jgi:hypothetical protein
MTSAPADPISNFIIQHNLLSVLWPGIAVGAIMKARKIGSLLKRALLDAIQGLEEVFVRLCDCFAHCRMKLKSCRRKELRADRRPPEKVKALARSVGAD